MDKIHYMNMTESIVVKLMKPYINEWRILYIDRFYNSIKLYKYMLDIRSGFIVLLVH